MDDAVSNILQCDEQLRTTLHCDDKEKLRRKLLYLQREYQRTAQRLQRAERSEAVQSCVRSRNTRQLGQKNQGTQEVGANPSDDPSLQSLTTANTPDVVHQRRGHAGDSEKSRGQVFRFCLPLKAACPQTPISSHESATGHRPSPSLRLRSRRSRLRWERQSSVVGVSTDSSQDGLEQSEMMEPPATQTKGDKMKPSEVVHQSEELISGADSESPSLLPPYLSVFGDNGARHVEERAKNEGTDQRHKESKVTVEAHKETQPSQPACKSLIQTEKNKQAGTQSQRKKEELEPSEDGQMENDKIVEDGRECEKCDDSNPVKDDKLNMDGPDCDVKGVRLLDSCTLVEGLLFPAEYYIRTTRRMTSSQSQPDMQAVILSQLNMGRHRRGRASGRRHPHNRGGSHDQMSDSAGACRKSQEAEVSAETNSQSSGKNSGQIPTCQVNKSNCFSAAVSAPRPARGRKRQGGRGRSRAWPDPSQCSFSPDPRPLGCEHTAENPQLTSSPVLLSPLLYGTMVAPSPSLCAADEPKSLLTGPVPADTQLLITPSTAAEHQDSGGAGTQDSPAYPNYPIFLKNRNRRNRSSQLSGSQALALPLPSPPAPLPSPPAPLPSPPAPLPSPPAPLPSPPAPLPSLSLCSFAKNLRKFDILQGDFHLPDDQFASLKLHKLRQVAVETGVEAFSSPSYCTRRSVRRYALSASSSDLATPLPVLSGSTPTVPSSPDTAEVKPTATPSVHDDATELSEQEKTEGSRTESSAESVLAAGGCAADCVEGRREGGAGLGPGCPGKFQPEENQGLTNHTDHRILPQAPSFSCQLQGSVEEPPDGSTGPHNSDDADAGSVPSEESPAGETKPGPEPKTSPAGDGKTQKPSLHHSIQSQLLLSPLVSVLLPTPQIPSSSPSLPSLGVTPQPAPAALPLTSSPSAPALILPPAHSPSTQALSPPPLSPCPSQVTCQLVHTSGPANESEGKEGLKTEEAEEGFKSCTHTLKTPSGGCLVDACCLPGSSGRLCVAAAGKWAVCLWTQISASDWNLSHTWSFNEMVISVFPVPDAAGLICVTLGQLEIRDVRILSCSSLSQVSLCDGLVQTVVGVSKSRIVTLSHSASGSGLWVFTLAESGSTLSSQPLVSPGVCVGALSPVHGLPDALIGTDENQQLFIWNLNTGQLLQKVHLEDGFSHSACLRGYSYCGVLIVLLQHQFLSSDREGGAEVPMKEGKTMGLLSLVAINPLSGRSILAARLYPPSAWSGRLCEVDVNGCSVVGLSQNGCVCVWELGKRGATRMVRAPESEGWQLARWGGGGMLLTGHHNGDVTLHRCSSPV